MAAIIRIIATTINSSMSENPFCFLFMYIPVLLDYEVEPTYLHAPPVYWGWARRRLVGF
jgi:hypothetical protein